MSGLDRLLWLFVLAALILLGLAAVGSFLTDADVVQVYR